MAFPGLIWIWDFTVESRGGLDTMREPAEKKDSKNYPRGFGCLVFHHFEIFSVPILGRFCVTSSQTMLVQRAAWMFPKHHGFSSSHQRAGKKSGGIGWILLFSLVERQWFFGFDPHFVAEISSMVLSIYILVGWVTIVVASNRHFFLNNWD